MPNWCNNNLTLTHSDEKMIIRARDALSRGEFFSEFLPVPEAEKDNWYFWCTTNWGTKWDTNAHSVEIDRDDPCILDASFDTAWSPPIEFYKHLQTLGFTVEAKYYEPGMCFAGMWYNGYDDFFDLGGLSAEEVEHSIPEELDAEFGISDSMYEWEAENTEES